MTLVDHAALRALPKVLLHDHLDGGPRPETVVALARARSYGRLPADDPEGLRAWFRSAVRGGGLEGYLAAFEHTVAVMQTRPALMRVARECAEDLAADGVVYAEIRFGPELHTQDGLSLDDVVEAVLDGFRAAAERRLTIRVIVTALRDGDASDEVSRLAVRWRSSGVVGFDLAGPEAGHPADRHLAAIRTAREGGLGVTIHAGEGAGPESIETAVRACGADRVGHGVRIVEALDRERADGAEAVGRDPDGADDRAPLVRELIDRRVPLEVCPTSNVDTGIVDSVADHPVDRLRRAGFVVTVNTDNRLMSGVTLTDEFAALQQAFGWGHAEFAEVSLAAARAAFCSPEERGRLCDEVIRPGFEAAR